MAPMSSTAPTPLRVAAIGFDLGETLYHYGDTPLSWVERYRPALEAVADACGIDRDKAHLARAGETLARYNTRLRERAEEVDATDIMTDVLAALGGGGGAKVERAVDAFFGFFRESLEAYPDAVETLARLKARGFTIGALTNVPYGMPRRTVEEDLERTGLAPYLDGLVTSVDVGLRKPERATFEWLAATLAVELRDMVYVGDMPFDVTGSMAAGCSAILIDRAGNEPDYGQAATIRELRGLLDLVELAAPAAS